MKRSSLPVLLFLALLVLPAPFAFCADLPGFGSRSVSSNQAPEAVVAMQLASPGSYESDSLLASMFYLLESDVEYSVNESTSVIVACNPFETQDTDAHVYHPVSNISVGLRVSF